MQSANNEGFDLMINEYNEELEKLNQCYVRILNEINDTLSHCIDKNLQTAKKINYIICAKNTKKQK